MNEIEIKKLIKKLENNKDVDTLSVYNPNDKERYYYYYDINGFFKNEYFSIYFMKFKISKNIKEYVSNLSVNPTDIKEFFNLDIPIL